MDKHLLQHYDVIHEKKCLDCGWASELGSSKPNEKSDLESLFKDIGSHLNKVHMIKADSENFQNPPPRKGFTIAANALQCIECNEIQDDVKSLQEHLKLCLKNTKSIIFVCFCGIEFADRHSFFQHLQWLQCKQLYQQKFMAQYTNGGFLPRGNGTRANAVIPTSKDALKRSPDPKEKINKYF